MNRIVKTSRNSRLGLLVVILGTALVTAEPVLAQGTRYVSDQLLITLRSGKGDEYRIIKSLPSGTRLELLEEDGEFARVRLDDGTEGWVRGWYLKEQPTAQLLVDAATAKAERLGAENKTLKNQLAEVNATATTLERDLASANTALEKLRAENLKLTNVAARPLELENENTQLKTESAQISQKMELVMAENQELRKSTVQKWFMAGSGVLVIGILMGLILPRLRRKPTSSW